MPTVTVVVSEGDLVDAVYNESGEEIDYDVIDFTAWENGYCPFCKGEELEHVNSWSEVNEIGVRLWYGGFMQCTLCGADENTNVAEWIKNGGIIK